MVIQFRSSGFEALHASTARQREECERIWDGVRKSLLQMTEQGLVDEQIRAALMDRDHTFRVQSTKFTDDVQINDNAMRNVQNIGFDGGRAMVSALQQYR